MRNGLLLVLILTFVGCAHRSQFESTHCGWGHDDQAAASAADRSAAEAWRVQQERLLRSSDMPAK